MTTSCDNCEVPVETGDVIVVEYDDTDERFEFCSMLCATEHLPEAREVST